MRHAERRRAERAGQAPRSLREIDYLLMVDDEARQGALRLAEREGGPFLAGYEAREVAAQVGRAVARWRKVARKLGLTSAETDRMASAFEHEDLALATRGKRPVSKTT